MFKIGYDLRVATIEACRRAGFAPVFAVSGLEMDGALALAGAGVAGAVVPGSVVPPGGTAPGSGALSRRCAEADGRTGIPKGPASFPCCGGVLGRPCSRRSVPIRIQPAQSSASWGRTGDWREAGP